jgi:anti-sigma factor RsiW
MDSMDKKESTKFGSGPMPCSEIELLVDDYVDGELSSLEAKRYERHLEQCDACRELVSDCLLIVKTARTLAERPVPPAVSHRLRQRLQHELGLSISPNRPRLSLVD